MMSEVPDKVIEQATRVVDRAANRQTYAVHGYSGSGEPMRGPDGHVMWSLKVGMLAASDVIAAWARSQERERIKRLVAAESGQARKDYNTDPQAYFRGVEDGMENLLAALDRDGSADTWEGEQP